jgi:oligosaccharide repeat unit polymerase
LLRRPSIFLHPLIIFSGVWLGVVFLYSLHLSKLLLYSTLETSRLVLSIWIPFAAVVLVFVPLRKILVTEYPIARRSEPFRPSRLDRQLTTAFRVWILITIGEILLSGGIPIVWLVLGSTKSYRDFGIPSLHGFVNSLLLTISLCRFALFLVTSERRHLRVPIFIVFWSILVVTRQLMLVSLIQFAVLFVRLRPIKMSTVFRLFGAFAGVILLFGFVGDYRSGSSDLIRKWAQPTDNYPDWLPSGMLWGYIYGATPINNLLRTVDVSPPLNNLLFPNTAATLFPSVLRAMIYGEQLGETESGQLVDSTFNVSTAYVGPYQDFGFIGVAIYSMLTAFLCLQFWHRNNLKSVLIYVVLCQCLILSLFWNQFLALPVITQVFWLGFFFRRKSTSKRRVRTSYHTFLNRGAIR